MRQIRTDGLLDEIDLENLDVNQEEEEALEDEEDDDEENGNIADDDGDSDSQEEMDDFSDDESDAEGEYASWNRVLRRRPHRLRYGTPNILYRSDAEREFDIPRPLNIPPSRARRQLDARLAFHSKQAKADKQNAELNLGNAEAENAEHKKNLNSFVTDEDDDY